MSNVGFDIMNIGTWSKLFDFSLSNVSAMPLLPNSIFTGSHLPSTGFGFGNPFLSMDFMSMFSFPKFDFSNFSKGFSFGNQKNTPAFGKYADIVNRLATSAGIDPKLISAIIRKESSGNANATSYCGAKGLMQLMDGTAKSVGVKNPFNPEENIRGGIAYFKQMLVKFGGDTRLALAAYNAGPGAVKKHGGIPPYKQTQDYVKKIMADYQRA